MRRPVALLLFAALYRDTLRPGRTLLVPRQFRLGIRRTGGGDAEAAVGFTDASVDLVRVSECVGGHEADADGGEGGEDGDDAAQFHLATPTG